ncbi:hypothetical protein Hamer_G002145 [Homarus americanus]|uniref:LolA-like domain-containing protein n=1 Tax=Homarus americanus TaxID=6706 RepID=A0A8J5JX24_HOMAM|nr:hypothetical protein Hamer_G002145 [Homarus americanus]
MIITGMAGKVSSVAVVLLMAVAAGETQYCDPIPDHPDPPPQPRMPQQFTIKSEVVQAAQGPSDDVIDSLVVYTETVYDGPGNKISMDTYSKYALVKRILDWTTKQMVEVHISKIDTKKRECILRPLEEETYLFPVLWGAGKNLSLDHIIDPGVLVGVLDCVQLGGAWRRVSTSGVGDTGTAGPRAGGGVQAPRTEHHGLHAADRLHHLHDFSKDRLFTFSLEARDTTIHDFTWADGWYDFEKQLYRIDHDVINSASEVVPTSEVFDFDDGVEFSFSTELVGKCHVTIINDSRSDWADITDINLLWADSPNAFFGTDVTNYTYYGPGVERFLQGLEWRGQRTDWPADTTTDDDAFTLWQWTFTADIQTSHGVIPQGAAFVYQLYDFNLESVGRSSDVYSDGGVFDTYDCYSANWRDHLKFKLDVSAWPEVVTTPLLTSARFNEHWQMQLAEYGLISVIRITRVKTIYEATGEVWVEFVLLYRHPDISILSRDLYRRMTPGITARANINGAVNNGSINFHGHKTNDEEFTLVAVSGSLGPVIDPVCTTTSSTTSTTTATTTTSIPTTSTTTTTTTTTTTSTTTPTTSTTTASTTTNSHTQPPTTKEPLNPLYTPGDLAGVGVGLLIIGLSIGAGGTFLVVVKKVHLIVLGWFSKG